MEREGYMECRLFVHLGIFLTAGDLVRLLA
jgi:hypothetical protein